jgi:hypothetical protein
MNFHVKAVADSSLFKIIQTDMSLCITLAGICPQIDVSPEANPMTQNGTGDLSGQPAPYDLPTGS